MKIICTLFTLLSFSLLPFAQDSWLRTDKFNYKWNEPIHIRILPGENFDSAIRNGDTGGLKKLEIYFNGVKDNLSSHLSADAGDSVQIKLLDEGTAMVVFHSNNYYREMDPEKFNKYLLDEKQMSVLEIRKELNETNSAGRERYSQNDKTFIRVGKRYTNTFKKETLLPFEIIPQQNPYNLKTGDSLEVKILYNNAPLTQHLIHVSQMKDMFTNRTELLTDENGIIKFPLETKGIWKISGVKMTRAENLEMDNPIASEWHTYRGSCSWGYE